jgi:hypothetical protein
MAISLATHGALVVACAGTFLWGGLPSLPVEIEVSPVHLDELRELPLGLPPLPMTGDPPGAPPPAADVLPAPLPAKTDPAAKENAPRPKRKPAVREVLPDAERERIVPLVKPTSVRSYAPEGSRVVALVRLDRLRGTPYADSVDGVLKLLPDRRDLLEGTEIDLYRDVDALLVATPNPLDAFATLLVVRHRLADTALRSALEKGARATGRKLIWHSERGRPFAERVAANPDAHDATAPARRRDARLILLAAPRLAVVTPPSYRKLLLGGPASLPAGPKGGAGGAGGPGGALADENGWASLVNRIDATDSILPENAVAMLSVAGVFAAVRPNATRVSQSRLATPAAPGTRGAPDDSASPASTVMGLPAPRMLTAVLGVVPQPFMNADAEFDTGAAAERWQQEWPQLRHQLLTNAIIVLTGLGHIIAAVTVERTESTLHIHLEATEDETVHILSFLAIQLPLLRR